MTEEEEAKIIEHSRGAALERTQKAAEKASTRWIQNHRVKIYEVGDEVWVRQRIISQRKGKIWQRTATINKVNGNHTYRLLWGKDGGYDSKEKPFSISLRVWAGKDLKPRISRPAELADSESDPDYQEEGESDTREEGGEEMEVVEENEQIPQNPAPKQRRIAKRRNKEKESEKEGEDTPQDIQAKQTQLPAPAKPKPSLCATFRVIGVEQVDMSLRRHGAKKARTEN